MTLSKETLKLCLHLTGNQGLDDQHDDFEERAQRLLAYDLCLSLIKNTTLDGQADDFEETTEAVLAARRELKAAILDLKDEAT